LNNNKHIIISDSCSSNNDYRIIWKGYEETDKQKSVLQYINKNSKNLRSDYLSWIYWLSNIQIKEKKLAEHLENDSGFSLWWMSEFVEKSNTKTRSHFKSIKFFALVNMLKKYDIKIIKCFSKDIELKNALKIYCKQHKIQYDNKINSINFQLNQSIIYHIIKANFFLLKYFITFFHYKKSTIKQHNLSNNSVFFHSYFMNYKKSSVIKNQYYSNYWKDLPELFINNGKKINWFHTYLKTKNVKTIHTGKNIINNLNDENNLHNFIENYFTIFDYFNILTKWILLMCRIMFLQKKLKKIISDDSRSFLFEFHKSSFNNSFYGSLSIMNLIWINRFNEIMKNINRQNLGFYLCENQGWERALIYYWKLNNHGKLIGVVHSTMPFWDLRYFQDKNFYDEKHSLPFPDYFAINSPIAKDLYKKSLQPINKLIEVEALRYLDLINQCKRISIETNNKSLNRILIVGDFQQNTTTDLIKIIKDASLDLKDYKIDFKPHPGNYIDISKFGLNNVNIVNDSLVNISSQYDYFITTANTSSTMDLILLRKNFSVFLHSDDFNASYLTEIPGIEYFYDKSSLILILMDSYHKHSRINPNEIFYSGSSLNKWKSLIN